LIWAGLDSTLRQQWIRLVNSETSPSAQTAPAKRFGAGALRFVQAPATRHRNLRGVYWKVIEPGMVEVGAPIEVISRPNAVDDIE